MTRLTALVLASTLVTGCATTSGGAKVQGIAGIAIAAAGATVAAAADCTVPGHTESWPESDTHNATWYVPAHPNPICQSAQLAVTGTLIAIGAAMILQAGVTLSRNADEAARAEAEAQTIRPIADVDVLSTPAARRVRVAVAPAD